MRKAVERYPPPADLGVCRQVHRRVERQSTRVVRSRYRMLRLDQTVSRELLTYLRPQLLTPRFVIVPQFVHPLVPDILQVLLIRRRTIRRF